MADSVFFDTAINFSGTVAQTMNLTLDFALDGPTDLPDTIVPVGATANIAGLNPLIGGQFNFDFGPGANPPNNDVRKILDAELGVAGLDAAGVDVGPVSLTTISLKFTNGQGVTDTINVSGQFVDEYILANADAPELAGAFGGFVDVGNGVVQVAARNYGTPATGKQIFLGANTNTSDIAGGSNEFRDLVGAFLSTEAEAQSVLDALILDDGSRFELGKRGSYSNVFLRELEEEKIVLEIQNKGTNAQNKAGVITYDKVILLADWEAYLDSVDDFATIKADYDAFTFA